MDSSGEPPRQSSQGLRRSQGMELVSGSRGEQSPSRVRLGGREEALVVIRGGGWRVVYW